MSKIKKTFNVFVLFLFAFVIVSCFEETPKTPTLEDVTYNPMQSLENIVLPEGWLWEDPSIVPTVKINKYVVIYEKTGREYSINLTVLKATPQVPTIDAIILEENTLDKTLSDVSLVANFSWKDSTEIVKEGVFNYTAVYTPTDTDNYLTVEVVLSVTYYKEVVIPTLDNVSYDPDQTLVDIFLPEGFSWKEVNIVPSVLTTSYAAIYTYSDGLEVEVQIPLSVMKKVAVVPEPIEIEFIAGDTLNTIDLGNEWKWLVETTEITEGIHEYTITIKDSDNYEKASYSYEITAYLKVIIPTFEEIEFSINTCLADIPLPERWSWQSNTIVPTHDVTNYKAVYTRFDGSKQFYSILLTVNQATANYIMPNLGTLVYQDAATLSQIKLPSGWSWKEPETEVLLGEQIAIIIYTPIDTINYKTSEEEITFSTYGLANLVELEAVTYSTSLRLSQITLPERWSWQSPTTRPTVAIQEYPAIFTTEDGIQVSYNIPLIVNKAVPSYTIPTTVQTVVYYEGIKLETSVLPARWTWKEPETPMQLGSQKYLAIYTHSDNINYEIVEAEVIAGAYYLPVDFPVLDAVNFHPQFKLSNITLPEGWTWEKPATIPSVTTLVYPILYEELDGFKSKHNIELIVLKLDPVKSADPTLNQTDISKGIIAGDGLPRIQAGKFVYMPLAPDYTIGGNVSGSFQWLDPNYVLVEGDNIVSWIFTPTLSGYNSYVGEMTIVAEAFEGFIETAKTTIEKAYDEIDLELYDEIKKRELLDILNQTIFILETQSSRPGVDKSLSNALDSLGRVLTKTDSTNGPTIITSLIDGYTYNAGRLTFDVWATSLDGKKITAQAYLNGEKLGINWDDTEKTSFSMRLIQVENEIEIFAKDALGNKTRVFYQFIFDEQPIEFTISVDAFTIGAGYLIEPTLVVLDEELLSSISLFYYGEVDNLYLKENISAAHILIYYLHQAGYSYEHWGSVDSGFYLSSVGNFYHELNVPSSLLYLISIYGYAPEAVDTNGNLGEFDYTSGSGWMYAVNNIFPNVGFDNYYMQDGDVLRVQFTLAYGADIGGGWGGSYFSDVNRDRIIELLALINSLTVEKNEIYELSSEWIKEFGIVQEDLDALYTVLYNSYKEWIE